MSNSVLFITGQIDRQLDGDSVNLTYRSGDEVFIRRMRRCDYRRNLETGLRWLNAAEAEERNNVVQMRAGEHG